MSKATEFEINRCYWCRKEANLRRLELSYGTVYYAVRCGSLGCFSQGPLRRRQQAAVDVWNKGPKK